MAHNATKQFALCCVLSAKVQFSLITMLIFKENVACMEVSTLQHNDLFLYFVSVSIMSGCIRIKFMQFESSCLSYSVFLMHTDMEPGG